MKAGNPALEEMLRKQRIKRCDELRRAHELGQPMQPPEPIRKPSIIDKVTLLYRTTRIIRTMKKSSWKTTVGGLLIAAGQAVPSLLPAAWHWLSGTFTGLGGIVLGMAARDNNVSSEAAGVR
jgi:hypothetical protein